MKNRINNETQALYAPTKHTLNTDQWVNGALEALHQHFLTEPLFSLRSNTFTSPDITKNYLTLILARETNEQFHVLFLDNQHRLIEDNRMFTGTIDGASVYPRVVAQRALEVNASAVIFAHNHPSGICVPSSADIQITEKLKTCLLTFDIRVLDHIIVGHMDTYSFAEHGVI